MKKSWDSGRTRALSHTMILLTSPEPALTKLVIKVFDTSNRARAGISLVVEESLSLGGTFDLTDNMRSTKKIVNKKYAWQ